GIVDGLPCLKITERRLAGVEENILDTQLEAEVDAGRIPDCEMPIIPVERCQVSPARDDVRFLRALAFHDYVSGDWRVNLWLSCVRPLPEVRVPHEDY